jgi:outer membrane protein OmpA-like peptidoglycan-associated protein
MKQIFCLPFLLVSIQFLLVLSPSAAQAQAVRRAGSGPVNQNTLYTYLLVSVTNGGFDQERRQPIDSRIPSEIVDHAVQFIRKRLELLRVPIFRVERENGNSNRIIVKLPALHDPERVKSTIVSSGRLELIHIISPPYPASPRDYPTSDEAFESFEGEVPADLRVLRFIQRTTILSPNAEPKAGLITSWVVGEVKAVIGTNDLASCKPLPTGDRPESFSVQCFLSPDGAAKLFKWTNSNLREYVGIILNGEAKSVAFLMSPLRNTIGIHGHFSKESVADLIIALLSGGLPRTYSLQYELERRITEPYVPTLSTPTPRTLQIVGYVDVMDQSDAGCRVRIISGDRVYMGFISFAQLTRLTGQKISTLGEAVGIFSGKKISLNLSDLDYSSAASGYISFGQSGQLNLQSANVDGNTNPAWVEQTTNTETIIDLSADILFEFNRSTINPNAVPTLIRLARAIRQSGGDQVLLNGFTDSIGSDEYNLELSKRRAATVKEWLVGKGGIDPSRLRTEGYGKDRPVAPNTKPDGSDNPAGRHKNRRVEIRIPRN